MNGDAVVWYSEPGDQVVPNEDAVLVSAGGAVVVVDGGTARTETGCVHGVAWFARQLADHIGVSVDGPRDLVTVLAEAIAAVAKLHPGCDLGHPGTPAAAVGVARPGPGEDRWEYLVLADVYLVAEQSGGIEMVTDRRVGAAAAVERAEGRRWPIGSPEQMAALKRMKRVELAGRGVSYWVAAADPAAAAHALAGELAEVDQLALLSDGAARAQTFGLLDWRGVLDLLGAEAGPQELVHLVRQAEREDPAGQRWPRNKRHDDASAVYVPAANIRSRW